MLSYASLIAAIVKLRSKRNLQLGFMSESMRRRNSAKGKKKKKHPPFHPGPGLFEDYAVLFDEDKCAVMDQRHLGLLRDDFQRDFRLTTKSFVYVLTAITGVLDSTPVGTKRRGARTKYTPAMKLATTLYYLSTGETYREVSNTMRNGMTKKIVMCHIREVTAAIVQALGHLICFPDCFDSFELRSGIPRIIGCIDGSHAQVHPKRSKQEYYINRKGYCSVVLSAVVDPRGLFMSIDTGYCGRMGDSRILQLSPLWKNAYEIFGKYGFQIYGDAAYPLREWLLVGYRNRYSLNAMQAHFNRCGTRARLIVEAAFGKLKVIPPLYFPFLLPPALFSFIFVSFRANGVVFTMVFKQTPPWTGSWRYQHAVFYITLRFSLTRKTMI